MVLTTTSEQQIDKFDIIYRFYKGTTEGMLATKLRIKWICSRAVGPTVLDFGCGKGAISILLAHSGIEVIGIDIDEKNIELANAEKVKQSPQVQQRIAFVKGDICSIDIAQKCNTVIMGQFLEHLEDPHKAVQKAHEILVDDGKLIITVPYGLLIPHSEHKQIFYLASLYNLLSSYFIINEIDVIWPRICLLCTKSQTPMGLNKASIELMHFLHFEEKLVEKLLVLTSENRYARRQKANIEILKSTLQKLRASFYFQLGNILRLAIRKPGRNTILLPYSIFKLITGKIKKGYRSEKPTSIISDRNSTLSTQQELYIKQSINDRIAVIKEKMDQEDKDLGIKCLRHRLKIAVIMRKSFYECLKYESELIIITVNNWEQKLCKQRPSFLLVTSDLAGDDSQSQHTIANLNEKLTDKIMYLIEWCRTNGIPTVFWNLEDPQYYEKYVKVARLFDFVFTIDKHSVDAYKRDLNHEHIYYLPFAVQPKINNPSYSKVKIRDMAITDMFYRESEETKLEIMLNPALLLTTKSEYGYMPHGVDIFSPNYGYNDAVLKLLDEFKPNFLGKMNYHDMKYIYKLYKIFLIGEISPTVIRKIFEVLSSGTCVLSKFSQELIELLGSDIVWMSSSEEDTLKNLQILLNNEEQRDKLAHLGLRKILADHTYTKRLDYILSIIGLNRYCIEKDKSISIITCTNKLNSMDEIFINYSRQNIINKELIIILNNNQLDLCEWRGEAQKYPSVSVYKVDEKEGLGTCLNYAIDRIRYDYVAKFDDDNYYGAFYLQDMLNAFDYSQADVIGKAARYVWFENYNALAIRNPEMEHCYLSKYQTSISGATLVLNKKVLKKIKFRPGKGHGRDSDFLLDCHRQNFKIYSSDRFNFLTRRFASKEKHTWKMDDESLLARSFIVDYTSNFIEHIVC